MNQIKTGKFISQKRKALNLTQEQLAEKLGVSNKTISKWETGKCMPDYSIIQTLCEELGISVAELMEGEECPENSVRAYDEDQVLDLLGKVQKLEKKNEDVSLMIEVVSVFAISIVGMVVSNLAEYATGWDFYFYTVLNILFFAMIVIWGIFRVRLFIKKRKERKLLPVD